MTLKEAVEIAQRKYALEKYSKYTYYINTNLMYNPCNFVTITIKDIYNKAYISDVGDTLQYKTKSEEEVISICIKKKIEYDDGWLRIEFKESGQFYSK